MEKGTSADCGLKEKKCNSLNCTQRELDGVPVLGRDRDVKITYVLESHLLKAESNLADYTQPPSLVLFQPSLRCFLEGR